MGLRETYIPKHLSLEQQTQIKDLILEHKDIYFTEENREAKLNQIKKERDARLDDLVDKTKISLAYQHVPREEIEKKVRRDFPDLVCTLSLLEYWMHNEVQIIFEKIDGFIPGCTTHAHVPIDKIIANTVYIIEQQQKELIALQDKVSEALLNNNPNDYGLDTTTFRTKVIVDFCESILVNLQSQLPKKADAVSDAIKLKDKERNTYRQTLLMYYLLEYAKLTNRNIDHTKFANLIYFLTGKSHDNIRKIWANPLRSNQKSMQKDLDFIRPFFEGIEAVEILKMIDGDRKG